MKVKLNNRGFLSADFLFAMVIGTTVSMMLFVICFTFSSVEVAQYIAYSTARAQSAGHDDPTKQEEMAKKKFDYLIKKSYMGSLFRGAWFELKNLEIRNGYNGNQFPEYEYQENRLPQTGIRLDFTAKIMKFKIPFLGASDEEGTTFKSKVTGLLFREPSSQECREQMRNINRYKAILTLDSRFSRLDSSYGNNPNYLPLEDNGC